jgi:hypothetical protein
MAANTLVLDGDKKLGELTVNEFLALNDLVKADENRLLTVKQAKEYFNVDSERMVWKKAIDNPHIIKREDRKKIRATIKQWKKVLL